jgi:hypothetical protein
MSNGRKTATERRAYAPVPYPIEQCTTLCVRPAGSLTICLCLLLLAIQMLQSCERPSPVDKAKKRTLTEDERYIVKLYMKITEIEENLQDNPELREKKWDELRREFDPERVRRILQELEREPERWLAVYGRIGELLDRREKHGSI